MSRDSTVIPFRQPDAIDDPLTELAREGARRILAQVDLPLKISSTGS
jgi:putative transposase